MCVVRVVVVVVVVVVVERLEASRNHRSPEVLKSERKNETFTDRVSWDRYDCVLLLESLSVFLLVGMIVVD